MENFRLIADESFPSSSLTVTSNNSGIFENGSISSNLGLPVAVSTVARNNYYSDDRYSDNQTSYPGRERFSFAPESYDSQSDSETKEKFDFSFWDRISFSNTCPIFALSKDEDIDDEEFYDDHLEAYFQQLAFPEMLSEDQEKQELPESSPAFRISIDHLSEVHLNQTSCVAVIFYCMLNSFWLPGYMNTNGTAGSKGMDLSPLPGFYFILVITTYFWCLLTLNHDTNIDQGNFDLYPLKLGEQSTHQNSTLSSDSEALLPLTDESLEDFITPKIAVQKNVDANSLEPHDNDPFWSSTIERRICQNWTSTENNEKGDLPHSVVYQNEEGKWVTDLAYYTSFDEKQDLNLCRDNEVNEEFRTGSEAMALIIQDEKEFEREHRFMQEEKIDLQNTSGALGDTSWNASVNYNLLRRSLTTSDMTGNDASYLRLSLGEFFGQRSEALGCLGGDFNVKRPSFGYFITSPEKREPVALLRESDVSADNLEQDQEQHVLFSVYDESTTFNTDDLETPSEIDENDIIFKGRTEDISVIKSNSERCEDKIPDCNDTIPNISTIASAIANASVSAEPSQLAAMIMALSNKSKQNTFLEASKVKGLTLVNQMLPSHAENNGNDTFDMEKYLKKTEVSRYEGSSDNFLRTGLSGTWDLSLSSNPTTQDFLEIDLHTDCVNVRETEKNPDVIFNKETEIENKASLDASDLNRATVNKMFSMNARIPDVSTGEKPNMISTPKPGSYLPVRKSTAVFSLTPAEYKEINDSRETQIQSEDDCEPYSSEKHVTFPKNIGTNHCLTNLKNTSSERDAQRLEDEQLSFRPSTSPLIHSSPSEIPETPTSGTESHFVSSSGHLQRPCDSALPQSVCSSPSMARLTYISVYDNTSHIAVEDISEKSQSTAPSELSTTIVRASPIPLAEQTMDNVKEKEPLQSSDKVSSINSNILDKNVEIDLPAPSDDKTEDPLSKSKVFAHCLKSGQPFLHNELGQVIGPLPSKTCLFHPALSSKIDTPLPCQDCVTQNQELTSTNMLPPFSGFSSHIQLPQNTSCDQYVPVQSLNSQDLTSETQAFSGAVPTLLPKKSLTTPIAQQYLGTISTGNVALSQYHIGSSTVYGHSGGFPCTSISRDHIHNSVAVGMCLGNNVGSGLFGPTSLCNAHSNTLSQNLLSTVKPFPGPPIGTYGIEPWESQVASEFGKVRVPEELKFPHACCVGIASQTTLSIFNPTDRWLQVTIGTLSITINGEKVDFSTCHCLVFKNKTVIGPHATEEIKFLFMPTHPGIFRCLLRVSSWPVSSDSDTIAQAEALASKVVLTALAENPVVEVEPINTDFLDFGDLTYGSWKVLPLKLINKTHAVVPIRLIINANAIAWRCFTFSKEPVSLSLETALQSDVITQHNVPSVINHVMYASRDGHDPEFLKIWVIFHAPKKQISASENLGPAEEFLARIDVEVDSPSPTTVIKSVALRARVGIARIHAPKDLQRMYLFACVGSSARQFLPLKNAGNINVYLNIKISDQLSHFSVDPENLFLKPEEEQEVAVSFAPKEFKIYEDRLLKILVQPSGPQYEVVLKGEVDSSGNKYKIPAPSSHYSDVPPVLSNKQFMMWGGVALGRIHLQKLALRNNSSSTTQHLRLLIRGQDQDSFQLQNTFSLEERLTSNCEIRIRPKEDINIYLMFAPTRISCMLAKLEIKQLGIRSQPGIKFSIPLSGYGGTSNLILENVKKLSDSYMVTVNGLIPGKGSRVLFSVRNTGSRAAYVKAICFKDSQAKVMLDTQEMRILPDKFVLKDGGEETITLIYNPTEKEKNCQTATLLSTIYFFGGDEISRQQYRRAMLHKPEVIEQILPEHCLLKNICFDEAFQNEQLITEVYDLPERPNDVQLFYGSMRKIILSVIGDFSATSSNLGSLQHCLKHNLSSDRNSERHINNVSLDVLPVKGPQGSPLPSKPAAEPGQNTLISQQTWTVQPEHLILSAPSVCGMTKTGHIHILNNSVRSLKFELSWPAHCLTVTPQHGVINPESRLLILVSPNSSFGTKPSAFPWSGLIYIHCDNGKKIVKVQIREDITQEGPSTHLAFKPFLTSESPVSYMVKPITKPASTKVEIKNKTIAFPETERGETSENYLELENNGDEEAKWNLSSFAPTYVKDVDESGDVFRATYTAFRCSRISGTLEGHGKQKIAITFLPRDKGNYAQFWEVECYPSAEPHMKHALRFLLSGVVSIMAERKKNVIKCFLLSTHALLKTDNLCRPRKRTGSEASTFVPRQVDVAQRGVYAPQDVYVFLPVRVGESRTVKVNLRNNSFSTHLVILLLTFPFLLCRAQHYINMPVQFKPKSAGKFKGLLVVQTDEGKSVGIQLVGEALEKF
uniref:Centrosomal protein 192 n=1 Tax=Monodelphis domestica TaxID=13616 RepID=A0A5F8G422_MONDO